MMTNLEMTVSSPAGCSINLHPTMSGQILLYMGMKSGEFWMHRAQYGLKRRRAAHGAYELVCVKMVFMAFKLECFLTT